MMHKTFLFPFLQVSMLRIGSNISIMSSCGVLFDRLILKQYTLTNTKENLVQC